jgi:hypothetical protein
MGSDWLPGGLQFGNVFSDVIGLFHLPFVAAGITFTVAVVLAGFTVRQVRAAFGAVVQKDGKRSDSD